MIKRIGVELKEGCDISGGDLAIKSLADLLDFDEIIAIDPSLIKKENPLFLSAVSDLDRRLKQSVSAALNEGHFPLVFGGDHALAIGSIAAAMTNETGIIWIDAHGDCNTVESSPSHRIHGMPLAVLQGFGHPQLTVLNDVTLQGKDILQIGIRSLDDQERRQMKRWGVNVITMDQINAQGFDWLLTQVQRFTDAHPRLHVSFDCDSVDPLEAPGVNTPFKDGMHSQDVMHLIREIDYRKVFSMDIVEYNPIKDNGNTKAMIIAIDALVSAKRG